MPNKSTRAIRQHRVVSASKRQQSWKVYLNGKHLDTVFYVPSMRHDEVKQSLIMHDGFNPGINVKKGK